MRKIRILRAVCALCAIGLHSIGHIHASDNSLGIGNDLFVRYALVTQLMDVDQSASSYIECPRRVKDTEYVWHPQPTSDTLPDIKAYVVEDGKFHSTPLSEVIISESRIPYISLHINETESKLYIDLHIAEVFAITKRRLVFICGPRNLVLTDTLQHQLYQLNGSTLKGSFPWDVNTTLTQEIMKIGTGLAMFSLLTGRFQTLLQGCGSRPSPLFLPSNDVTVDRSTGVTSCVVDPMSPLRIGFVCEGRIEPKGCMKSLLDEHGRVVTVTEPHLYWNVAKNAHWVAAMFFHTVALPPIKGECRCVDPKTGNTKARIEVRSRTDYVCDIARKIFRNRHRPIRGPWCSVVLHPGSTLTIKLPMQSVSSTSTNERSDEDLRMDVEEDVSSISFSQLSSVYEYESEFLPTNVATMRQQSVSYDNTYDEKLYHNALVGDAIDIDVSQISRGEVKLKYHRDKPLTLRRGLNSFYYHWTLVSRNDNVPDMIRAIVNVSFALTHNYAMLGSDVHTQSLFDPSISQYHCSVQTMGNGIGRVYECLYQDVAHVTDVGIHCGSEEELFPNNCEATAYDLYSNKIVLFPGSVRNATLFPIRGFQLFKVDFEQNESVSLACLCVDKRGYEISRMIMESNQYIYRSCDVKQEEPSNSWFPFRLIPWSEFQLLDQNRSSIPVLLNNVTKKFITLNVGTQLAITCAGSPGDLNVAGNLDVNPMWLPIDAEEFHYAVRLTLHGHELVRTLHRDVIGGTVDAFLVSQIHLLTDFYVQLVIDSRRGGIIISKHPDDTAYVPLTFVCGKTPNISEISMVPRSRYNVTIPHGTLRLAPYTWHVVEVNVETTDPYMQGCGVTYDSDELFKPATPQLYDSYRQEIGCKIDIQSAKEAAFYCPAPYVLDPPDCFNQVLVEGEVKNLSDISESLAASHSNHFVILKFHSGSIGPVETLRKTPPLECRCVTIKGIVLSTIHIENYYAK
ncbi:hypothetical protein BBBOND_0207460 [Babesia bigemina]|uniref:6-Cys domain-containing protein n=1 Tax=Babesia bigemina TaxID=5866 RepID=A0A061D4C6_BABBI|nr:hypothetical protein BBBOND_0207460 [Babesia bigemina]CDR95591.1 hypothetical protein BBBOND_0207460 [Babesia bigemina]|eukprot:XP_012767777.1 hypothetical protein BBBOND_0207460 [Babesia bigemina]